MTGELAERLANAGLSSVKFSFQGVDKVSYREMRQTDFFEGMQEAIERIRGVRNRPWIQVSTSTTYETPEQVEAFLELMSPLADQISIGKTIFEYMDLEAVRTDKDLFRKLSALESTEKRHPDPCPEVFDKLSISVDGTARVCCNDYNGVTDLGNVNVSTLREMWRHPEIEAYRKRLAQKNYDAPLCETCWDYMDLTDSS